MGDDLVPFEAVIDEQSHNALRSGWLVWGSRHSLGKSAGYAAIFWRGRIRGYKRDHSRNRMHSGRDGSHRNARRNLTVVLYGTDGPRRSLYKMPRAWKALSTRVAVA